MKTKRYLNYVKMFKRCLDYKLFKRRTPLRIKHYITYRCNLNCAYCYTNKLEAKKEMTTEQIKSAMNEFKELGTVMWTFIGGEPLVRKDIGELIKYAKSLGFTVNVCTNGILVKDKIEEIKDVDSVLISLEGPKKVHDKICKKGTFDKVIEGVHLLNKEGIKPLLSAVISKKNIDYVDYLIDLSLKENTYINFSFVNPVNERATNYTISKEKMFEAINRINDLKKRYDHISCSSDALMRNLLYDSGKISRFQDVCLAGSLFCAISPEGKIVPCYVKLGEKDWPNGIEMGFKNAFHKMKSIGDCDCNIDGFYNVNQALSIKPKTVYRLGKNVLKKRWIFT